MYAHSFREPVFSPVELDRLERAFVTARALGGLILVGYGPKLFSAGGDLRHVLEAHEEEGYLGVLSYARRCRRAIDLGVQLGQEVPTIGVASGRALGGGAECLMACSYWSLGEATMSFPEYDHPGGLFPFAGGRELAARHGFEQTMCEDRMSVAGPRSRRWHPELSYQEGVVDTWAHRIALAIEEPGEAHRLRRIAELQRDPRFTGRSWEEQRQVLCQIS